MIIAFRTDASSQIGTGHFMRCLTLADELKRKGAKIIFISRHTPQFLAAALRDKGFVYKSIKDEIDIDILEDLPHSLWLGTTQENDAKLTNEVLADISCDWIVVDHYALDHRWEKSVRTSCKKIMVIDDLADRQHACDVLLDQNYYEDMSSRYANKVQDHCQLLLGPSYALLKDDFKSFRTQIAPHSGEVKKILVFFGGIDAADFTSLTINTLAGINRQWSVDVVIGLQHPNSAKIQKTCDKYRFKCHVQTARMAELMSEADLSIGAGGTAIWERCCLGLPAIVFCTAENQREQVADAGKLGVLYAPQINELNFEAELQQHLESLIESPSTLQSISELGKQHVNGQGARKVVHQLIGEFIEIRRAEDNDSLSIFHWRNDEKIRNVSKSSEMIPISVHQKWFENALRNTHCELLIGSLLNRVVGVVRFDIEEDSAEISIYLVPNSDFIGYGRSLLLNAEKWLKKNRTEVKTLRAFVKRGNASSEKLFTNLNYEFNKSEFYKII